MGNAGPDCSVIVRGPSRLILEALAAALDEMDGIAASYSDEALDHCPSPDVWLVEAGAARGDLVEMSRWRTATAHIVLVPISPTPPADTNGAPHQETTIEVGAGLDELAETLRSLHDGPGRAGRSHVRPVARLSTREAQVLGHLAAGVTQEGIATRLAVSSQTVRTHIQNAMTKLGAHTRQEAIVIATDQGLLGEPQSLSSRDGS